jgi:hypothetical protein
MSDAVEVGSLAGTWVAAGVAIIALIGVLGPLLVWRAMRTERHQAIDRLSQGGADTAGYVSTGVRVTSTIRLFRHFNAPNLRSAPSLCASTLNWDDNTTLVDSNSASWVQLGKMLECYNVECTKTRSLEIRDGQVWLPVHRIWFIIMGIVGRYGKRKDEGKFIVTPIGGIASTQAKPGGHVTFASTPGLGRAPTRRGSVRSVSSAYGSGHQPLYGITGSIETLPAPPTAEMYGSTTPTKDVLFRSHTTSEIGILPKESVAVMQLFWLAVGCLPALRSKVYSLDDVESVPMREERQRRSLPNNSRATGPRTYNESYDTSSDTDSDNERSHRPRHISSTSNTCVVPNTTLKIGTRTEYARAFQFSLANRRVAELDEIAESIHMNNADQVFSLEELKLTPDVTARLWSASEATYVPTDFPWVRFIQIRKSQNNWFLKRDDAQLLAQALLSLPMSSLGYLVGGNKHSKCRQLLCAASQSLFQLLIRFNKSLQALNVNDSEATQLTQLMEAIYMGTEKKTRTRPFYEAIYDLDVALATRLHPDTRVNNGIGVLMITNEEFRDIITQSARHIDEAINTSIVLDVVNGTLNVPAVMGFTQRFPLALALLHPELPNDDGPITITFGEVIFAALKASVRSTFLETSLDSLPLFRTVLEMDTVVWIASSQR